MNHLIDLGVCALVGFTNDIILHNYFKKIFQVHFGCSNLILHSVSPIIRRKAKRKVQSCRTVKWPRGLEIVLKLGKCHLSDESIL